jgi:hypothetical protein
MKDFNKEEFNKMCAEVKNETIYGRTINKIHFR